MRRWVVLSGVLIVLAIAGTAFVVKADPTAPAPKPPDPKVDPGKPPKPPADAIKSASSRITQVTVYQNNALVTREVEVPAGAGIFELIVTPMPPTTVNSSLYSEAAEGMTVLTTRFRTRAIMEDTREEVRKLEAQMKERNEAAAKISADIENVKLNIALLGKLENFTAAGTQHATDKGTLNGDTIIALTKYVMDTRSEKTKEQVDLQQQLATNQEQVEFIKRQLQEAAAGTTKTDRDAVIVVDKKAAGPSKVRLNYLVDAASWRPQYKFRAARDEKEAVQLEYLAGVTQQTGEDWKDVALILSTAQPMLNAAPPQLAMLDIAVGPAANMPPQGAPGQSLDNLKQARDFRGKAQEAYNSQKDKPAGDLINKASALEQSNEILWCSKDELDKQRATGGPREGQSVTYHLDTHLTVPSRNDEQVLEVARLTMEPEYFYKAVPVLTPHVYRLANLTNKSKLVLLPGEATMYLGTDFVGRMDLPLVAVGEQFTAGFGVDPQLQVTRQLLDKSRTMQGGNQVLKYDYRILVNSYKSDPVNVQVWDRLPHAENETVGVSMGKTEPEVSSDAMYLREEKPHNLLRWDLKVEPAMNGEKAKVIHYDFKLELDKQLAIGNFQTK